MLGNALKNPLLIGAVLALGLATAGATARADAPARTAPGNTGADPGMAIVTKACQSCHDLGMVTETRHTTKEWTSIVQRMRSNGAELSDDEAKQVQAYLAKVYGKPG
jgi:cytochrome c553